LEQKQTAKQLGDGKNEQVKASQQGQARKRVSYVYNTTREFFLAKVAKKLEGVVAPYKKP
jgi:hypothetical protein